MAAFLQPSQMSFKGSSKVFQRVFKGFFHSFLSVIRLCRGRRMKVFVNLLGELRANAVYGR